MLARLKRLVVAGAFALGLLAPAIAVTPGHLAVLFSGAPFQNTTCGQGVTTCFDFMRNLGFNQGTRGTASQFLTTSRASVGYVDDTSGNWTSIAANLPRISNKGMLVEEARTNGIRNNSWQGYTPGTPGSGPTNSSFSSSFSNLAITRVGSGTESGIDYGDVQYSGTSNATTGGSLSFETNLTIAALYGQTWTASAFVTLVGGSNTGMTYALRVSVRDSGGASLTSIDTPFVPAAGALGASRVTANGTITNSAAAFVNLQIIMTPANATAINFTLRVGWPQIENNSISSTVASATVAAGGTGGTSGTGVYSVGGGTCSTPPTLNITVAGGAITTINSVANAGSCTVFPPSPAALTYVSGTATGVTGATVTLTPTNNAANAFVTSPIRTTSAAATRAADVISLTTPPTFGAAYSIYAKGTPMAPTGAIADQILVQVDDGSANNRLLLQRNTSTGKAAYRSISGGVSNNQPSPDAAWAQNASGKLAVAMATGDQAAAFNGGTLFTSALTLPVSVANVRLGVNQAASVGWLNGYLERAGIWATQRLPNATLQAITTP